MNEIVSYQERLEQLGVKPISMQLFTDYSPIDCLLNRKSILHEQSHIMRVAIYADLICQAYIGAGVKVNRHAILSAIRIHDSYRTSDYTDESDHGLNAANHAYLQGLFQGDLDEKYILALARWHSVDDNEIIKNTLWGHLPIELQILKDADALDRFRDAHHDGVETNGPDPSYLRLDISHILLPVAQSLCSKYFDPLRIRNINLIQDLTQVAQSLGIMK